MSEPICSRMGSRAGQSASGMCSEALLWKLLAGHLGKRAPKDLTARVPWVDQLRAAIYQRLPGADDCHMGLALFAPVLEWVQELGVHYSSQASQDLKASTSSVLRLLA